MTETKYCRLKPQGSGFEREATRAGNFVAIHKEESLETVEITSKCFEGKDYIRWGYEYMSNRKSSIRGDEGEIARARNVFLDRDQKDEGLLHGMIYR